MNRRQLLSICGAVVIGFSLLAGAVAAGERPNLLVIQCDELHAGKIGCYGDPLVKTPHIDSLAKDGIKCTRYYAASPVCTPSRGTFFTGRYPQANRATKNNRPLADNEITFGEVLRRHGYATGYAGKWHLDGAAKPGWSPKRKFGFDDNRFMFNRGHWKDVQDTPKGGAKVKDYETVGDEKSFTTDWLTTKALAFLAANKRRPFCYVLSIPDPHGPNLVRAPFDSLYSPADVVIPTTFHDKNKDKPVWGRSEVSSEAGYRRSMSLYYGMIACVDYNVGRVLDALEKLGLAENTIVVFTADHGDLCGEHGRHNKGNPYEGSSRIPFLIRYPGNIGKGQVLTEAMSTVDFMPTVLTLMGVGVPRVVQGVDRAARFSGEEKSTPKSVVFLRDSGEKWLAAVDSQHKLIVSPMHSPWLFDLKKDPDERVNLALEPGYSDIAGALAKRLYSYTRTYGDPLGQDAKVRAQLEALQLH